MTDKNYPYGFTTNIQQNILTPGLSRETIQQIVSLKGEPDFILRWRLESLSCWQSMKYPTWANLEFPAIDFQSMSYYAEPTSRLSQPQNLEDIDPEILKTYEKLGIPLQEQRLSGVAVDAILDSVSIFTTSKDKLQELGIIFCSISEAISNYPHLIKKYMGTVVPMSDNYFACLNAAVFSDGSFVYIPKNVVCPLELVSYFRINNPNTGQFERTLIIAEENSSVSYLEGCTAPRNTEHQLHAAVVELIAHKGASIKYATVQNWYPGNDQGEGGIYNFVTKRGLAEESAHISWVQVETGASITWKYPSVILKGDNSCGEFYSVAVTKNYQQADTGTKMIHIGKNTKSTILAKSIVSGQSVNSYRGLVKIASRADNSQNFTKCDSLLLSTNCKANTYPHIENTNKTAAIEHEASISRVSELQILYIEQRGLDPERAVSIIVNGFCKSVFSKLPLEFAVEVQSLMDLTLKNSVG